MNEQVRQALVAIVAREGVAIMDDPRRLRALLYDHCPGAKQQVNVLMVSLGVGVPRELVASAMPPAMLGPWLARRLEDEHAIATDVARWAVETWAVALGIKLPPRSVPPPPPELPRDPHELVGRVLPGHRGQYLIQTLAGQRGGGVAYDAEQLPIGGDQRVTITVLDPLLAASPDFAERFHDLAGRLARSRPHLVPLADFGADGGLYYLVSVPLVAETLAQGFVRHGRYPWSLQRTLDLARQLLPTLDDLHRSGIVHGAVRPDTILVHEGDAYLTGAGLATLMGIPNAAAYMPPEQAQGEPVDGRADLYAFGVVLLELLTGRAPSSPALLDPALPAPIAAVLQRALEDDPRARYGSAGEMAAALPAPEPIIINPPLTWWGRFRGNRVAVGGVGFLLALLILGGTALAFVPHGDRPHLPTAAPPSPTVKPATGGATPPVGGTPAASTPVATGGTLTLSATPSVTPAPPTATATIAPTPTATRPAVTATPVPPTVPPTPVGGYGTNFGNWPVGDTSEGTGRRSYDSGQYHVALLRGNLTWSIYAPERPTFTDFVLEVDARRVPGPDPGQFGLSFRAQLAGPNDKDDTRYVFGISPEGFFELLLYNADNTITTIKPLTGAKVNGGDAFNHLTVTCKGDQITLAINGTTVGTFKAPAGAPNKGLLGLYVKAGIGANGVEAAFKDLRVTPLT